MRKAAFGLVLVACRFDSSYRDVPTKPPPPACNAGVVQCHGDTLETCKADETGFDVTDDCAARGLLCAPSLLACAPCLPGTGACKGHLTDICKADGSGF